MLTSKRSNHTTTASIDISNADIDIDRDRVVFVGAVKNFIDDLRLWLQSNHLCDVEVIGPDDINTTVVEADTEVVNRLSGLLRSGEQPANLFQAIIPPSEGKFMREIVPGEKMADIDASRRNMGRLDRSLGTPPSLLAEKGW